MKRDDRCFDATFFGLFESQILLHRWTLTEERVHRSTTLARVVGVSPCPRGEGDRRVIGKKFSSFIAQFNRPSASSTSPEGPSVSRSRPYRSFSARSHDYRETGN